MDKLYILFIDTKYMKVSALCFRSTVMRILLVPHRYSTFDVGQLTVVWNRLCAVSLSTCHDS